MRRLRRAIGSMLRALAILLWFAFSGASVQAQERIGYVARNDASALFNQGSSLLRSNHNQEAAAKFERACALSPNFAEAHHEWGVALLKLNRTNEAIDQFNQAMNLDPSLTANWLSLGTAYQSCGRSAEALSTYRTFLSRFPQDDDVNRVRNLIAVIERGGIDPSTSGYPKANTSNALPTQTAPKATAGASAIVGDVLPAVPQGKYCWPARRMPLRVYIANGDLIPGFRPLFAAFFREAFLRWAEAGEGLISFTFVDIESGADIVCRWNANILKYKNSAEPAQTNLYSDSGGLAKGEIEILTMSPLTKQAVTEKRMRATMLHEVGHVLGLTSHTVNPPDIMFNWFSLRDNPEDLSEQDKNTLTRLYKNR